MLKGDWEVWTIERRDRDTWAIQLQCANQECPSADGEPMAYIEIPVAVGFEPEDRSVGIGGGWIAESLLDRQIDKCFCGNPLPKETDIENEVQEHVAGWAESEEDPRDDYNRDADLDRYDR